MQEVFLLSLSFDFDVLVLLSYSFSTLLEIPNLLPGKGKTVTVTLSLRRDDRVIDFALSSEIPVQIQVHVGGTSSDHKPILSTIPVKSKVVKQGRKFSI
jgi:hypothetical protein